MGLPIAERVMDPLELIGKIGQKTPNRIESTLFKNIKPVRVFVSISTPKVKQGIHQTDGHKIKSPQN